MTFTAALPDRFRAVLAIDPLRPAILFEGAEHPWSWLGGMAAALDAELEKRGLGDRTEIAVVLRNRPEHCAAAVAVLASGRCLVTASPLFADGALVDDLRRADPPVVVAGTADWDRPGFDDAARAAGWLGIELTDGGTGLEVRHEHNRLSRTPPAADGAGGGRAVAVRMLTSGTTGPPKRVELTYRALEQALASAVHYETADTGPRLRSTPAICWAPLVHISGLWAVVKNVADGRPTILMERFEPEPWAAAVRRYGLKVCGLTPTALRMVLDAGVPPSDLASLRAVIVGTAPTPPELVDRFHDHYGIPVLIVYGATEFAGAVAGWTRSLFERCWADKRGSVGRAHPGISLRVVHPDTGGTVDPGSVGLLEVRGGQLDGVGGATADSWIRTTDLARLDADGFLYIEGRADDVIIRGGFKVSPARVAAALERHPAVREAGVTGLPDDRLGRVPVAAVELADGVPAPTEQELTDFARQHLAAYEVPRTIRVVDALPRTPSMKVSQPRLRDLF